MGSLQRLAALFELTRAEEEDRFSPSVGRRRLKPVFASTE
jgi:hypothetical protein